MPLNLMYITNRTDVALIAEQAGVDRIFIDLEYIGKELRQGGMNTVQNHHTPQDVLNIKKCLTKAKVLARVNPIHNASEEYCDTETEINEVISAGADYVMLPYFKTVSDVKRFLTAVNRRTKTVLLFESAESISNIDEILALDGIDEAFIGLNDLSLDYGKKFLFSLLADGTVATIIKKFKEKNISFGFGGMATLEGGLLPGKMILAEHYALKSNSVILSRAFCDLSVIQDKNEIKQTFENGIKEIRDYEKFVSNQNDDFFNTNHHRLQKIVKEICE